MSINKAFISGNLTRSAEVRSASAGTQVTQFGVAVNDRRKNPQTGDWEDYPNFIDCIIFGTRGEKLQPYLVKGSKVAIEGKLRWSQWERDGQKRSKIEVIVDEIELLSKSAPVSSSEQGAYTPQPQTAPQAAPQYAQATVYDEDIPF